VPASSAAFEDAQVQALWSAFCAGAQVQMPLPAGSGVERMHIIGRILRSAVEGTLQLMAVRASTKHEMRAAVTQIQARSNNPLKFSPDGASGIEQLVQPPARGFLDGPAAMDDAMRDLVAHSIGTVAGMRAAIEGMLDRFDPAELEGKLTGGSVLDSVLPMNRKARLWELYLQHYRAIREEAQEDFHTLFGKAFVAAYEQQVERLKQRPRS
jgi:FHA domain-containing protein